MRIFIEKFVRWQMKIAGRIVATWAWEIYQPRQKKQGKVVPGRVLHEIPGQSGRKMYDCGVFACMYAKYSSEAGRDPVQWNFTHEDVPTLRLMMVRDIVTTFNLQRLPGVDSPDDMD